MIDDVIEDIKAGDCFEVALFVRTSEEHKGYNFHHLLMTLGGNNYLCMFHFHLIWAQCCDNCWEIDSHQMNRKQLVSTHRLVLYRHFRVGLFAGMAVSMHTDTQCTDKTIYISRNTCIQKEKQCNTSQC